MATAMYLEHYLDSLESLPTDLQRNFNLMRDLDQRAQDVMKEIDKMAEDYLANVKSLTADKRSTQIKSIQKMFIKTREFNDDKVQLAMQTYEMVDKHIRRLDSDLARFEADLKEKTLTARSSDSAADSPQNKKGSLKAQKRKKDETDADVPKNKKKKKGDPPPVISPTPAPMLALSLSHPNDVLDMPVDPNEPTYCLCHQVSYSEMISPTPAPMLALSLSHPNDVLDMPVDPNEPTYCLCHQVSYGEMIGCDNPDCPIEWFHFACVGFTIKPKGKWYCPRCTEERKKK